jgi:heme exporter protein C
MFGMLLAMLMLSAVFAVTLAAPTEDEMGIAQRILYVHVSVAWFGLSSMLLMALSSLLYLRHRNLQWDFWAQAAAELGWLCCSLTLVTGSLWAQTAWATWWTWDPRLLTSFVLWLIFTGCLWMRGITANEHRSACIGAAFAIVGLLDIPLVIMATRWFRGIHPISPEMEPSMYFVLAWSLISFTAFFWLLLLTRRRQVRLESQLNELQRRRIRFGSAVVAHDHQHQQESFHGNFCDCVFYCLAGSRLVRRAADSSPTQARSNGQRVVGTDRRVRASSSTALIAGSVTAARRESR